MTLPVSQQRTLGRIEHRLLESDPRLAAMFLIFTKLTWDEEMPRREEVRARLAQIAAWLGRHTAPVRRLIPWPSARMRAIIFFPAALAAMACALLISTGSPAAHRCATTVRAPAAELIVKARQCRTLLLVRAPAFGH